MYNWKEIESLGYRGCASVWPKINQLRAELRTYENVHGFFDAMKIEAQRHLIELPIREAEKRLDKRMLKATTKLTDKQREKLIRLLETYESL